MEDWKLSDLLSVEAIHIHGGKVECIKCLTKTLRSILGRVIQHLVCHHQIRWQTNIDGLCPCPHADMVQHSPGQALWFYSGTGVTDRRNRGFIL